MALARRRTDAVGSGGNANATLLVDGPAEQRMRHRLRHLAGPGGPGLCARLLAGLSDRGALDPGHRCRGLCPAAAEPPATPGLGGRCGSARPPGPLSGQGELWRNPVAQVGRRPAGPAG